MLQNQNWEVIFKKAFLLQLLEKPLFHFVTWSREYYKWLSGLRHHNQICMLSVQTPWVFWQAEWSRLLWGSMWPTVETRNKAVMNIRWWMFLFDNGLKLVLPYPNDYRLTLYYWFKLLHTMCYVLTKASLSNSTIPFSSKDFSCTSSLISVH